MTLGTVGLALSGLAVPGLAGKFTADADPGTRTGVLSADTDGGSVLDGVEDTNRDGAIDLGETDPLDASDDVIEPSALVLDLAGGGGCATSAAGGRGQGGGSGGLVWALAVLAMLALLRQRRWAQVAGMALLLSTAATALLPAMAHAQLNANPDRGFAIERFRMSVDAQGLFDVEWAGLRAERRWDLGLWLGGSASPLVLYDRGTADRELGAVVSHRVQAALVGAYSFGGVEVGGELPMILSQDGDTIEGIPTGRGLTAAGVGDVRLVAKIRLLDRTEGGVDVALVPGLKLPTAGGDEYMGDDGASFEPEIAASGVSQGLRLAANLGYRARKERSLFNLDVGDEVYLRLGGGYMLPPQGGRPLEADVTLSGAVSAQEPFKQINQSAVEAFAGLVSSFTPEVQGFGGLGVGLHQGFGTPDWRVVIGVRMVGDLEPALADASPPEPAVDELSDRDGDGIVDSVDECPDIAGPLRFAGCETSQLAVVRGDRIDILQRVYFETNKAVIRERSFPVLTNVADVLHRYPDIRKIEVQGHTDSRGTNRYNMDLSRRRAESVRRFLLALRVESRRIRAVGYGETSPMSDNHTPDGLAENRRVEFHILDRTPVQDWDPMELSDRR